MVFQREFMTKSGSALRKVGTEWEHMLLHSREDQCNCADSWNVRQSKWDQKMQMMECIIRCMIRSHVMRYKMRCKLGTLGSPKYILPVSLSISTTPVSPYIRRRPEYFHHPCNSRHAPSLSPLPGQLVMVVRNRCSHHSSPFEWVTYLASWLR